MSFIFVVKRVMISKNSIMETQTPAVNHESLPIKLNPAWNISQMIMKTIPISARIVISNVMKQGIPL